MRTKLDALFKSLTTISVTCDVIVLTETWLTDSIASTELFLEDYNIYRQDRNLKQVFFERRWRAYCDKKEYYLLSIIIKL